MTIKTIALAGLIAFGGHAQTTPLAPPADNNIASGGISYQPGTSPSVVGSAMYLKAVSPVSDGTTDPSSYAFTFFDALPLTVKPFTVTTNVGMGIAPKLITMGGVPIYAFGGAGFSYNGSNPGWAWSGGGFAKVKIAVKGKVTQWRFLPSVRMVKSSVAQGQGYGIIGGAQIGWGWQ